MYAPITFFRPELCQACKNQTIEIYDYYGNPLGYTKVIDRRELKLDPELDKRAVYQMKCRRCGVIYDIVWVDGYPLPDLRAPTLKQQFINLFKKGV
jgi:hypothetical protein